MTVRIVHKNSVAEDKRPTAGQLANGEIAVNLHEGGAFLSIKDTAGNVQQVGGVKVSSKLTTNPVKGPSGWIATTTRCSFDGTQWRGVTGGGGGGGGSVNIWPRAMPSTSPKPPAPTPSTWWLEPGHHPGWQQRRG